MKPREGATHAADKHDYRGEPPTPALTLQVPTMGTSAL